MQDFVDQVPSQNQTLSKEKLTIKPGLDLNRTSDCQVNYMCINSGQY